MIIVIGGSSYLGQNLSKSFSDRGTLLTGTYYSSPKKGLLYFDITDPNIKKLNIDLKKADYGVICSAIPKIDECKRDEKKAYSINVTGTKKLIEQFWDHKIIPVFLSSDFVFNGNKGDYSEQDETNPCTIYGSHKKEIEDFLLKSNGDFLIARISKIFGLEKNDGTILTDWLVKLKNRESINCATDQIFCPTYIQDLTDIINLCIEKKISGLYNIASPEKFSRFDLACKLKTQLKISSGKVVPCSIKDFNFLDSRSLNTSLKSEKILHNTGFKFTEMTKCISDLEKFVR